MADQDAAMELSEADFDSESVILYHEAQESSLCGVHTINTLLQGPVVDETNLATIALDLDALEAGCMAEHGTHTADYQRFQNEGSNNVSADGNFSVQVLHKALEVWGLTATPLGKQSSPDNVCTDLEAERAFICHMMHHWFTVRKVCGQWWNFNSLLPAPAPLSPFHLSTLIGWLQNEGCTIFIVRGNLPDNMMSLSDPPRQARLMTAQEARDATKKAEAAGGAEDGAALAGPSMLGTGVDEDDALQRAIAASLA